jgi:hypothetical protein
MQVVTLAKFVEPGKELDGDYSTGGWRRQSGRCEQNGRTWRNLPTWIVGLTRPADCRRVSPRPGARLGHQLEEFAAPNLEHVIGARLNHLLEIIDLHTVELQSPL